MKKKNWCKIGWATAQIVLQEMLDCIAAGGKLYCNTVYRISKGGLVWLDCIVLQYKDCIARGLAGQKAVSRYKICIVTKAARLVGVSRYSN